MHKVKITVWFWLVALAFLSVFGLIYHLFFMMTLCVLKGPSTLAFFASVVPSAMAPPPNSFLCFSRAITSVIVQTKQLGGGAIADGETDAKNASVDGPLGVLEYVFIKLIFICCKFF
jgi:hypothetical protein